MPPIGTKEDIDRLWLIFKVLFPIMICEGILVLFVCKIYYFLKRKIEKEVEP